jgi:hypothetical protein
MKTMFFTLLLALMTSSAWCQDGSLSSRNIGWDIYVYRDKVACLGQRLEVVQDDRNIQLGFTFSANFAPQENFNCADWAKSLNGQNAKFTVEGVGPEKMRTMSVPATNCPRRECTVRVNLYYQEVAVKIDLGDNRVFHKMGIWNGSFEQLR